MTICWATWRQLNPTKRQLMLCAVLFVAVEPKNVLPASISRCPHTTSSFHLLQQFATPLVTLWLALHLPCPHYQSSLEVILVLITREPRLVGCRPDSPHSDRCAPARTGRRRRQRDRSNCPVAADPLPPVQCPPNRRGLRTLLRERRDLPPRPMAAAPDTDQCQERRTHFFCICRACTSVRSVWAEDVPAVLY